MYGRQQEPEQQDQRPEQQQEREQEQEQRLEAKEIAADVQEKTAVELASENGAAAAIPAEKKTAKAGNPRGPTAQAQRHRQRQKKVPRRRPGRRRTTHPEDLEK